MTVYLKDLFTAKKEATINIFDKQLKVTYDPNQITAEWVATSTRSIDELCEILPSLIVDWELSDESGKVPITAETFKTKMRLAIVNRILSEIINDAFPKQTL